MNTVSQKYVPDLEQESECIYMDGNGDTIGVWEPEELDFELSTDNDNFEIEVQQQFIDIFHKAIQQDLVSITHIAGNHSDTIAESNSAPTIGNTEIPVSTQINDPPSTQPVIETLDHSDSICDSKTTGQNCSQLSTIQEKIDSDISGLPSKYSSLRSFLQLKQSNYNLHFQNLKKAYLQVKEHARVSLNSFKLCKSYIQQKFKQECARFAKMQEFFSFTNSPLWTNPLYEDLYFDEKMAIDSLVSDVSQRKQTSERLCRTLKAMVDRMMLVEDKIQQRRTTKEYYIETNIIDVAERIGRELQSVANYKLKHFGRDEINSDLNFRSSNPYLKKDVYLQMKYLAVRQSTYIRLMQCFKVKLVSYISGIFEREEGFLFRIITDTLLKYAAISTKGCQTEGASKSNITDCKSLSSCKSINDNEISNKIITDLPQNKRAQSKAMTRAKMIQFEEELVVSLTKLIPLEMYCFNGECGLAEYISGLNSYLENMIFLKTIEVPEECVVYRCQAEWRSGREQKPSKDKKQIEECETVYNLQRQCQSFENGRLPVELVISSNRYLHIESNGKVATLKINNVRVKIKQNQIIIFDRRRGYFKASRQLGRIHFLVAEEANLMLSMMRPKFIEK